MLTVITPATASDLTTVDRARTMLGLTAGDDDMLAIAIPQVSQMVVDHCRRPFSVETVREVFRDPSRHGVLLARAPVTSFLTVTEGETALAVDQYEYDASTGTLHHLSGACRVCWYAPLRVEYVAGYSLPADTGTWTLPAAIERATLLLIGTFLSARDRDPLVRSETVDGIGSTSWWIPHTSSLPSPEAEGLLAPYRRIVG